MGLKRKKQINEKRRKSILAGPSSSLGPSPGLGPKRTRKSDSLIFSESHDDSDEESKDDIELKKSELKEIKEESERNQSANADDDKSSKSPVGVTYSESTESRGDEGTPMFKGRKFSATKN